MIGEKYEGDSFIKISVLGSYFDLLMSFSSLLDFCTLNIIQEQEIFVLIQ